MLIDKLKNKLENADKERTPAQVVVQDVVAVKKGERVLIIANPATNEIAQDLFMASSEVGALPTLIFQPDKPRSSCCNCNRARSLFLNFKHQTW